MRLGALRRALGGALGVAVIGAALSACGLIRAGPPAQGRAFATNGERIYFTGTSDSGDPIGYQGGPSGPMMMSRLACASCHGDDGKGGRARIMMQSVEAPNITWPALTQEHHVDREAEHPPFTEETVKRAITQGLDPAGKRLGDVMPRWRMSERDLVDLVVYLKTLR